MHVTIQKYPATVSFFLAKQVHTVVAGKKITDTFLLNVQTQTKLRVRTMPDEKLDHCTSSYLCSSCLCMS